MATELRKGRWYLCIKDYHDNGACFTRGKLYKCERDKCMKDDYESEKTCVNNLFIPVNKEQRKEIKTLFDFNNN